MENLDDIFCNLLAINPSWLKKRKYFKENEYWHQRFFSIVNNNNDNSYNTIAATTHINFVIIQNTLLDIYDYKIIYNITNKIIPNLYNYEKRINLWLYVLDLVTENKHSFKKKFPTIPIISIYADIFIEYTTYIIKYYTSIPDSNIIYNSFNHMIKRFLENKHFFKYHEVEAHPLFSATVKTMHLFIMRLYHRSAPTGELVNFIKYSFPINIITIEDECILHSIFKYTNDVKRIKNFLSFIFRSCKHFRHLNLRNNQNLTPLQLASLKNNDSDIIRLLLDHGSVVIDLNDLRVKYPSLNIFENYVTLQNLAAKIVKENNSNKEKSLLPQYLQNFINCH